MTPSSHVSLKVRQQPQSALVTLDGKEKSMSLAPSFQNEFLTDCRQRGNPSILHQSWK
jgi:hypothetical protein